MHWRRGYEGAVLFDGGQLVFLRRGWPGGTSYYRTVGGGVEAEDADLEAALSCEVMEEIGATIGPASEYGLQLRTLWLSVRGRRMARWQSSSRGGSRSFIRSQHRRL
ncbi:NUDIX domain-containing protein [Streptomyces sviceus]|uniref:NUDIX domain-containing protein n=1 Tax=Streptomyces sviceus TaxID=285530 RepID=UPI0036B67BB8